MPQKVYISVTESLKLARELGIKISRVTVIKHAEMHDLGHQIGGWGGKWVIHREKFRRFICGKNKDTNKQDSKTDAEEERKEGKTIGAPTGFSTSSNSINDV